MVRILSNGVTYTNAVPVPHGEWRKIYKEKGREYSLIKKKKKYWK